MLSRTIYLFDCTYTRDKYVIRVSTYVRLLKRMVQHDNVAFRLRNRKKRITGTWSAADFGRNSKTSRAVLE